MASSQTRPTDLTERGENQNHPGWQRRKSEKWMMMPEQESKADRECNDLSLSVTSHLTPHTSQLVTLTDTVLSVQPVLR